MAFPAQIKDIVYKLLQEPTLDKFREFIQPIRFFNNSHGLFSFL